MPGQVRNVRIVTLTPSTSPAATITDPNMVNTGQAGTLQAVKPGLNRSNSSTPTINRTALPVDASITADLAAKLNRMKSMTIPVTESTNDNQTTARPVVFSGRTLTSTSPSTTNFGSKLKSATSIDPATLTVTTKTPQTNIVLQLPTNASASNSANTDEQSTSNTTTNINSQNLMRYLSLLSSNTATRPQSPTAVSSTTSPQTISRVLPSFHQAVRVPITPTINPSTTNVTVANVAGTPTIQVSSTLTQHDQTTTSPTNPSSSST